MRRINRHSKVPLYHQLYEILRQRILDGEWKPGDMVSPESELISGYGVSRTTVRQVLDMLANEGLIYRQRGRGTFVAHPTIEQSLVRIVSFTEDMQQRGNKPGTRILRSETVPAPAEIATKLQIAEGTELALLERLRLADEEPMGIEQSHLVHRLCPGILEGDYVNTSLRQALEIKCDIRLARAQQVIRAVSATPKQARLLSIDSGAALLLIERVTYSHHDVPVEFLRILYRGDRYSLYTELQG